MAQQPLKKTDQQIAKGTDKASRHPAHQSAGPATKFLFGKRNFIMLFIGLGLLALGFSLMTGGSQPPDQFNPDVVYSFRRITLSSIVVVVGFVVVLFSIFQKHEAPGLSQAS